MGKPFESELHIMNDTYQYILNRPIKEIVSFISRSYDSPLLAVGSGGSLTAASLVSLLHEETGSISKALTPYELVNSALTLRNFSILLATAGGNNPDIVNSLKHAIVCEPRNLMAICMRPGSKISEISKEYPFFTISEFDLPAGKDGFLATNSLIGFFTVLIRAYFQVLGDKLGDPLPAKLTLKEDLLKEFEPDIFPLLKKDTWTVLYGGWGLPAAVDLESKFTEAALGNIQLADYRNFAHGRHHWFAKRGENSGLIALVTPDEIKVANQTLELLPKDIPIFQVKTNRTGPAGTLDLLIKVFHLVLLVGNSRCIDPGRPGVPAFGRKIYNLRALSPKTRLSNSKKSWEKTSVLRKVRYRSLDELSFEQLSIWQKAFKQFCEKIKRPKYGSIVFDYDGTLCDAEERFADISYTVTDELVKLLQAGIIIGIATGRGKSVKQTLRNVIPKSFWNQVIIGYYNGSDIATLNEDDAPNLKQPIDDGILIIAQQLASNYFLNELAKVEVRPKQITIEPQNITVWNNVKNIVLNEVQKVPWVEVRVLESSHSIDIIAKGVSKLNVVHACKEIINNKQDDFEVLCIGDKGDWPGNDFELLSTSFSLSVDEVSPDVSSCWNLSGFGHRGVQATLGYLKALQVNDGYFILNMKGGS